VAAGPALPTLESLRGKSIACPARGPERYFELFELARAGLGPRDVKLIPEPDSTSAARALREGCADAAAGLTSEVALAAKDRAGKVLATTGDAPHLVEFVLVVRGDQLARYPESVRRLVRGVVETAEAVLSDKEAAARLLDSVAPALGDPLQAINDEPPASKAENAAFFGLGGDAPVRFDELFTSAANLGVKLGELPAVCEPAELRDLMPLRSLLALPTPPPP
jgi:ABC-type nitrate/sulfonate/bicarbonate transport system substrate-binding protein